VTNAAARKKEANRVSSGHVSAQIESRPTPPLEESGQKLKTSFGVTLLGIYVFLLISRALDIAPVGFLHLPMIMLLGLGVIAVSVGDWQKAVQSKVTVFYGMFTGWVLVCFPMSNWRGGSLDSVILAVEAYGLYLVMVQLVKTTADWNRVALAFSYAALAAAILSFFFGRSIDGRIALVSGTLGDPNTFALSLVLGLPFWWYKATQSKLFGKALSLLAAAVILISFGRAGSRAGLVALGIMVLTILFFSGIKQKIAISVLAVIALVASMAFLPGYIRARFITIFQQHADADLDAQSRARLNADIDSSEGRQRLLQQSIRMTFEHPLFGVGPGVFREVAWDERKARQEAAGQMLVSHNTYTQISSETGIPGFVFFMGAFLTSVQYSLSDFRRLKRTNVLLSRASLYTFSSLVALGFGIFFLSIGYSFVLTAMFGLAASLHIVRSKDSMGEEAETTPALPAGDGVRTPEMVLAERRRIQPSAAETHRSHPLRSQPAHSQPAHSQPSGLQPGHLQPNQPDPDHRVRFGRYVDRG
jgi:O-antigen ligase